MSEVKFDVAALVKARDKVNSIFVHYAGEATLASNFESLSQLALIGGRLDKLIRDEGSRVAAERRQSRFREDVKQFTDIAVEHTERMLK